MDFDINISGRESVEKHKADLQDKYVAAFTNLQNLDVLISNVDEDLKTTEEIKALDELIKGGEEELVGERDKQKQMFMIKEQHITQIEANNSAIEIYTNNIIFLNKQLGA